VSDPSTRRRSGSPSSTQIRRRIDVGHWTRGAAKKRGCGCGWVHIEGTTIGTSRPNDLIAGWEYSIVPFGTTAIYLAIPLQEITSHRRLQDPMMDPGPPRNLPPAKPKRLSRRLIIQEKKKRLKFFCFPQNAVLCPRMPLPMGYRNVINWRLLGSCNVFVERRPSPV
jgi:hypothetical protein